MRLLINCCTLLLSILLLSNYSSAAGLGTANVKFGKPQNGGAECMGKGICELSSREGTMEHSVSVTFVLIEDPEARLYTLTMQFNISLMSSANHDYLYQHFLYSDGEPRPKFVFEGDYTIMDEELCRSLGIYAGQLTITPESYNQPRNIEKLGDADIRLTYVIPMSSGKK